MNRRGFIGACAAFALDPERLLWVPGAKLISIPAPATTWRLKTPVEILADINYAIECLGIRTVLDAQNFLTIEACPIVGDIHIQNQRLDEYVSRVLEPAYWYTEVQTPEPLPRFWDQGI